MNGQAASRPGRCHLLLLAFAFVACSGETTTALDLRLTAGGTIEQIEVQSVTVGGTALDLAGEQILLPSVPRVLATGEVLTLWFADSAGGKIVTVTAIGRACGQAVTAPATSSQAILVKGQHVGAALALQVDRTPSCDAGMDSPAGAGGRGGSGAGGTGTAGTTGAGGVAGSIGGGGGVGGVGAGGTAAGTAGTTGGRGGATGGGGGGGGGAGTTGGRGGTGGGGVGGAAGTTGGRGGTTGGGGGGAAGTTGVGGAAGAGGASGGRGGAAGGGGGGAPGCSGTTDGVCPAGCTPCTASCATGQDIDCKLGNGTPCTHLNECVSGNCVGNVCCNSACSDSCNTCASGTCAVVASGGVGSPSCSPYRCNGSSASCPTSCASDAACVTGYYCDGTCRAKKADGGTCTVANECQNGRCVDGYCCNAVCGAACDVCNRSGSLGMCTAAASGATPSASCGVYRCNGTSTACPTSCSSNSHCVSGTTCQSGTCQTCDPTGSPCASSAPQSCCSGSCVSFNCQ